MASLKSIARDLLSDAQDGISYLVIWKDGRSWCRDSYFGIEYDDYEGYSVDTGLIPELREIVNNDPDAIAICGYYDNIGWSEDGMTLNDLMNGIRFQREVAPGSLAYILASYK